MIQSTLFDAPIQPFKKHLRILMGGSPCTHWSIAQSKNRETTASGIGWELFENYLYARDKFKPDYYLYENNASAAPAIKGMISQELGANLQYINSALVSAQNRERFYCHNIPNVPQPEDHGILLMDVLDSGMAWTEKGYTLKAQYYKSGEANFITNGGFCATGVAEPVRIPDYGNPNKSRPLGANYSNNAGAFEQRIWNSNPAKQQLDYVAEPVRIGTIEHDGSYEHDSQPYRVYSPEGKAVTQCGQGGGVGAKTGLYACPVPAILRAERTDEAKRLRKAYESGNIKHGYNEYRILQPREDGKSNTISTVQKDNMLIDNWDGKSYPVYEVRNGLIEIKGKQYPIRLPDGFYIIRKLTVSECRRLQTIPDWFIMPCSASQNYKMLGNGWTVKVPQHILSFIPGIQDCTVELLSMYDGMGCARIVLDELGCKTVRYDAYEIDKYCIQTTKANFADVRHCGDAFAVRQQNWAY